MGPRVIPILSGQGYIHELTSGRSLTQREGMQSVLEITFRSLKCSQLETSIQFDAIDDDYNEDDCDDEDNV